MKNTFFGLLSVSISILSACVTPPEGEDPVKQVAAAPLQPKAPTVALVTKLKAPDCSKKLLNLPMYLKDLGVVITQYDSHCEKNQNHNLPVEHVSLTAMGVPCTGGMGRIEIFGNYYNPKIVRFLLSNDCQMKTYSAGDLKEALPVGEDGHVRKDVRLLALYPFAPQFGKSMASRIRILAFLSSCAPTILSELCGRISSP